MLNLVKIKYLNLTEKNQDDRLTCISNVIVMKVKLIEFIDQEGGEIEGGGKGMVIEVIDKT